MQNHSQSGQHPRSNENLAGKRIVTVSQVPEIPGYQWLTENALRHMIFASKIRYNSKNEELPNNGMQKYGVVIRLGRRVLIDLDAFDEYLDDHREIQSDEEECT